MKPYSNTRECEKPYAILMETSEFNDIGTLPHAQAHIPKPPTWEWWLSFKINTKHRRANAHWSAICECHALTHSLHSKHRHIQTHVRLYTLVLTSYVLLACITFTYTTVVYTRFGCHAGRRAWNSVPNVFLNAGPLTHTYAARRHIEGKSTVP